MKRDIFISMLAGLPFIGKIVPQENKHIKELIELGFTREVAIQINNLAKDLAINIKNGYRYYPKGTMDFKG